jgi:hypothetical protein
MGEVMNRIDKDIDERIHAYTEILDVISKHKETLDPAHNTRIPRLSGISDVIEMLNVSKKFGIPIYEGSNSDWMTVDSIYGQDYMTLGFYYGERIISCPDDGRQPSNEWLMRISFPTGAYVFGNYFKGEYPTETFGAFFEELRSYGPKYSDTPNKSLYFSSDNARQVYEAFDEIFERHKVGVVNEMKRQKRLKLEQELERLNEDLSNDSQ